MVLKEERNMYIKNMCNKLRLCFGRYCKQGISESFLCPVDMKVVPFLFFFRVGIVPIESTKIKCLELYNVIYV